MTPRQRVEAVLGHQIPDRTLFTIYENMLPQCTVERELRNAGLCEDVLISVSLPSTASWYGRLDKDVADSALDYVEAFTPAPDTDMSLEEVLKAWPDKVLWINFPSSLHLASTEVIERTTEQFIEAAAPGDRFILGITEDIPEGHWQRSLQAISRAIQRK